MSRTDSENTPAALITPTSFISPGSELRETTFSTVYIFDHLWYLRLPTGCCKLCMILAGSWNTYRCSKSTIPRLCVHRHMCYVFFLPPTLHMLLFMFNDRILLTILWTIKNSLVLLSRRKRALVQCDSVAFNLRLREECWLSNKQVQQMLPVLGLQSTSS